MLALRSCSQLTVGGPKWKKVLRGFLFATAGYCFVGCSLHAFYSSFTDYRVVFSPLFCAVLVGYFEGVGVVDSSESNHITLILDMSLLEVAEDIRYAPLCLWQLLMQFTSFLVSCCSCLVILNRFVCFFSWMPRSSNKKQTGWISLSPLQ